MSVSAAPLPSRASDRDIRRELGLRPIINVSGTMTALGTSIMVPEAIAAMAAIAPEFVEIDHLQRAASRVIARLTGGEAGRHARSAVGMGSLPGNITVEIEAILEVSS